ncbi:MAG: gamma-glutamyl-gamma-aminobutyrate hydrolase family protein, partial [Acidobacteriaceae bacterium]|nr:gamma-glutamyl-gamma-aminobutyrate hydrolase family protein [Acidobacteriaceae bacterium]
MPNLATWIRACDEKYFARFFTPDEEVRIWNAARADVPLEQMHGLLLTGGADVAPQYLHQDIPNPAVIEKGNDPKRDAWEFAAVQHVLAHELPILAICKGV